MDTVQYRIYEYTSSNPIIKALIMRENVLTDEEAECKEGVTEIENHEIAKNSCRKVDRKK